MDQLQKQQQFNEFLDTNLNTEQRTAVLQKDGVLVVCAGAGSGKTRVITARITNLILNEAISPSSIIALTFTNKAAHEMQERVQSFLPKTTMLPYVGTFHSYCLRLLKANQHLLSISNFSILDDDDQKTLLQKIITDNGLTKKVTAKQIASLISKEKNNATSGNFNPMNIGDPLARDIFVLYEQEKRKSHCFDFDDLLLETLLLFNHNAHFRATHQAQVRHILVDEYQDTNLVQHALLKAMTTNTQGEFVLDSLCIVGDEDQSIYSWRGATVHNIINFKKDFPQTIHIAIEQNYRSAQPILEAANAIIQNNSLRNPKNLWSTREGSDRLRIVQTASEYQEGDCIAEIARATFRQPEQRSCAVLYRSHYQSRAIEEVLIRNSIPYRIIGGIQFYERQEIKDLLAYMRLCVNPFDRVSFLRIYNTPARGLGDKFEELFFQTWDYEHFLSYADIARHIITQQNMPPAKIAKLQEFLDVFSGLSADQPASRVLSTIINKIKYLEHLQHYFEPKEAQSKIENVKELLNAIHVLEEQGLSSVHNFLDEVALLQDHAQKAKAHQEHSCLFLMTLHAAKGLEFDTVILPGLEEGVFPSSRSMYDHEALEEERRLMYVGITRAREHLFMSWSRHRYVYGSLNTQQASQFLQEIPAKIAQFDDISRWRNTDITAYISSWISGTAQKKTVVNPAQSTGKIAFDYDTEPFAKMQIRTNAIPYSALWKKKQTVEHASFGPGIIEEIEEKPNKQIYLTVQFADGTKKIDSRFIKKIN